MRLPFQTKKSNGVPVAKNVHDLIVEGNASRDAGRWGDAQAAYYRVVQNAPELAHIWVQLGHAEIRLGHFDQAEAAYLRALAMRPDQTDPLIHLGHVRKDTGDLEGAARYYLRASREDPKNIDAFYELQRLLSRISPSKRSKMHAILSLDLDALTPGGEGILLDITAIVSAVLHGRSLSDDEQKKGEWILAFLDHPVSIQPCAHIDGRPEWVALSIAEARRAVGLGLDKSLSTVDRGREAIAQELVAIFAPALSLTADARLIVTDARDIDPGHAYFLCQAQESGATLLMASHTDDAADVLARAERIDGVSKPARSPASSTIEAGTFGLGVGQQGLDFRRGFGWMTPQQWGSWTHARGAELALPIETGENSLKVSVLLRGLPSHGMKFSLVTATGQKFVGEIRSGEERWVTMELPRPADGMLRLFVKGDQASPVREQSHERQILASIGVVGFHLCSIADQAARMSFLEEITLSNIRWN